MLCDVILRQLTVTPGKEILSLSMREFCFVTSVISESPQEPSLGSSSRSSSNSTRALDFPTIGTLFQQYILPAASAEEYTMHGLIRDILHTVLNFAGNGLENLIPVHRNPWQIFQLKIRYYNALRKRRLSASEFTAGSNTRSRIESNHLKNSAKRVRLSLQGNRVWVENCCDGDTDSDRLGVE